MESIQQQQQKQYIFSKIFQKYLIVNVFSFLDENFLNNLLWFTSTQFRQFQIQQNRLLSEHILRPFRREFNERSNTNQESKEIINFLMTPTSKYVDLKVYLRSLPIMRFLNQKLQEQDNFKLKVLKISFDEYKTMDIDEIINCLQQMNPSSLNIQRFGLFQSITGFLQQVLPNLDNLLTLKLNINQTFNYQQKVEYPKALQHLTLIGFTEAHINNFLLDSLLDRKLSLLIFEDIKIKDSHLFPFFEALNLIDVHTLKFQEYDFDRFRSCDIVIDKLKDSKISKILFNQFIISHNFDMIRFKEAMDLKNIGLIGSQQIIFEKYTVLEDIIEIADRFPQAAFKLDCLNIDLNTEQLNHNSSYHNLSKIELQLENYYLSGKDILVPLILNSFSQLTHLDLAFKGQIGSINYENLTFTKNRISNITLNDPIQSVLNIVDKIILPNNYYLHSFTIAHFRKNTSQLTEFLLKLQAEKLITLNLEVTGHYEESDMQYAMDLDKLYQTIARFKALRVFSFTDDTHQSYYKASLFLTNCLFQLSHLVKLTFSKYYGQFPKFWQSANMSTLKIITKTLKSLRELTIDIDFEFLDLIEAAKDREDRIVIKNYRRDLSKQLYQQLEKATTRIEYLKIT